MLQMPMASTDHYLTCALNLLSASVRNPIVAVSAQLKVNLGMAMSTVFSGMACSAQGMYVVADPHGQEQPLSLYFWVLAGSTIGKTRTHKLVHVEHHNQNQLRYTAYKQAKKADPEVRLRDILLEDITPRGLIEALDGDGEAISISAHEGQRVLQSYLMRRLDIPTSAWDGERLTFHRAKGDRVVAYNHCLNMLVMVQPEMFRQFIDHDKGRAQGIGYWPRCLMMQVATDVPPFPLQHTAPADSISTYYTRVAELLTCQRARQESATTAREIVTFSPEACELWERLLDQQRHFAMTLYWHMPEAANRAMQNVARIAAVIHTFSGAVGGIPRDTLLAAWYIVQWYLGQFAVIFPATLQSPPALPKPTAHEKRERQIAEDANTIMFHFNLHVGKTREPDVPKSTVATRSGLYPLRFNAALFYLTDGRYVVVEGEGKKARLRAGERIYAAWPVPSIVPGYYGSS